MASESRPAVRFEPKYCAFFRTVVWAIQTQQADGSWRVVNCLDKDEPCFSLNCAFTSLEGEWPYKSSPMEQPQSVKVSPREWPRAKGGNPCETC